MAQAKNFLDPQRLLSEIISSDFDLSRFNEVDETHLAIPPNFVEWITGRDFCNSTLLPWQVEAGMHLFSDYCPTCSNPEYLTELFDEPLGEIQDNVQFLKNGICQKCHKNRLELFTLGDQERYPQHPSIKAEFIGALGQRSGKSKYVACAASYQINQWNRLPDPLGFYGLPTMEVVLGTFSALSAEQAEENLWMPFRGLVDAAPWFKKYHEFLKAEEKRLSIPLCDVKDTYLFYPHKRLLVSFTGSDDRKKRGRTRLFGAIDEIAFLNSEIGTSKKKVMDADKNYAALNNSLSTIRRKALMKMEAGSYDAPMAIMYNVSSPYNVQDKIMRLTKNGQAQPMAVVIHRATWNSNPDYTEKACRAINPGLSLTEFERDFGAIPPYSDSPFISEVRIMERLCAPHQPLIHAQREVFKDAMGDRFFFLRANVLRYDRLRPRLLALDNGYNQNGFAAVVFSYDFKNKKPILDFAVNLMPDQGAGLNIHFPQMFEQFITPLLKGLAIKHVFYDRWQSLDQIHRIREMKIDAQAYSLSYEKDFLPFKQMLISGNLVLPPLEIPIQQVKDSADPTLLANGYPIANLIWQALTVREVGRKILKPLEGDDDLFRAFVLGGSRFLNEEIASKYSGFGGVRASLVGGNSLGVYKSLNQVQQQGSIPLNRGPQPLSWARYRSSGKK